MKTTKNALKKVCLSLGMACAAISFSGVATAAYPEKPIKMVVSFPPGGPVDIAARIVGARLTEVLKQSVFIDNKTGAAGNVGTQQVAKSPNQP